MKLVLFKKAKNSHISFSYKKHRLIRGNFLLFWSTFLFTIFFSINTPTCSPGEFIRQFEAIAGPFYKITIVVVKGPNKNHRTINYYVII